MVRIERAWSAVCVAVMALAGCDSGAGAVPLEELEERSIEAGCAHLFGCCSAEERDGRVPAEVTTEVECVEYRRAQSWDLEEFVEGAVATGRYEYDAAAAGACLAAVRSCEASNCQFTTGIVANGSACGSDDECGSQWCDAGTCTARPGLGEACTSYECGAGLTCVDGACSELRGDGAACASWGDCLSGLCDESGFCAPRNICG